MGEPFDWMVAKRNPDVARAQKARRETMYRAELEDRAALLARLGYARETARARLRANARWDFPDGKGPIAAGDVDSIIERVFGGTTGGKPTTKARTR